MRAPLPRHPFRQGNMRARTVVLLCGCSVVLLGATTGPNGAPRPAPSSSRLMQSQEPQSEDMKDWRLIASAGSPVLIAQLTAGLRSVAPYFDNVRLEREVGSGRVVCGTFSRPVLTATISDRFWSYTMSRPSSGACATAGGRNYIAIGTKEDKSHPTQGVP
jgi:hypothetical protein